MLPDRTLLACTGRADDMVADSTNPHARQRQEQRAKAIRAECPVLDRCRAWALHHDDDLWPAMVVGGMTPGERRREKFGASNCGTKAGWMAHRTAGSEACQACRLAWNAYSAEYRRAWRAKKRNDERKGAA